MKCHDAIFLALEAIKSCLKESKRIFVLFNGILLHLLFIGNRSLNEVLIIDKVMTEICHRGMTLFDGPIFV